MTIKGGSIGEDAFNNCRDLTSLSLQEGVTSIGSQAFNSCMKIKDLVIPSTVKSIGEGAFKSVIGITVKVLLLFHLNWAMVLLMLILVLVMFLMSKISRM